MGFHSERAAADLGPSGLSSGHSEVSLHLIATMYWYNPRGVFHWCSDSNNFVTDNSDRIRCFFYNYPHCLSHHKLKKIIWIEMELIFYPYLCVLFLLLGLISYHTCVFVVVFTRVNPLSYLCVLFLFTRVNNLSYLCLCCCFYQG